MSRLVISRVVDEATARMLDRPKDGIVAETAVGDGRFDLLDGPFHRYRRELRSVPVGDQVHCEETIEYKLASPVWRLLFAYPVRRELRRARSSNPWWAPPDRFDAPTTMTVSLLALLMVVSGYLGTVIGQTITFAADEFGNSKTEQGITLAAVRIGTLLTFVAMLLADRRGRRPVTIAVAAVGCLATVLGAAAPNLFGLGLSQTVARACSNALSLLLGILAAETAPRGSRAYVAAALTLAAGLGSGMVLWVLPVADLGESGWRVVYLVPAVFLLGVIAVSRLLPESQRFIDHVATEATGARIDRRRLALVAITSFAILFFAAPASQFEAEFLRTERGFSATQISVFTLVTAIPAGLGVAVGGRLADVRGRRMVGMFAIAGATTFVVLRFGMPGPPMWGWAALATVLAGMASPVLGVYSSELFGTGRRGRANGIVILVTVCGSASGLLLVGWLADELGSFVRAFVLIAPLPLLVALLIGFVYPETANRSLEELNPEPPEPPATG